MASAIVALAAVMSVTLPGSARDRASLDVALISVCGAWDALTNDRHYRSGRSAADAEAVLRGGAGSQWHPRAVDIVLAAVADEPGGGGLAGVGRRNRLLRPAPSPWKMWTAPISC